MTYIHKRSVARHTQQSVSLWSAAVSQLLLFLCVINSVLVALLFITDHKLLFNEIKAEKLCDVTNTIYIDGGVRPGVFIRCW